MRARPLALAPARPLPRLALIGSALAALALAGLALAVRVAYAQAVVFPGLDDPAFYVLVARNLAAGRGLVIDALWSYQLPFAAVSHPSHEYWMPLASLLMAPALALLGPGLWPAQLPGLLAGALLAPFTWLVGRRALPATSRAAIALAAALIALSATLAYQSASLDSAAVFALSAALALAVAAGERRAAAAGAGLLAGLAYLARGDGLLLPFALALGWWLLGRRSAERYALLAAGFALIAGPWWLRNWLAFGSPTPVSLLASAWQTSYLQTFNFARPAQLGDLLALGAGGILALRRDALLVAALQYVNATFAWGLLAPFGLWHLRRRPLFALAGVYALLLLASTTLVFSVQTQFGTFYHSLGATLPFLALATVAALEDGLARVHRPQYRWLAAVVLLGLALYLQASAFAGVRREHLRLAAQFEAIAGWLEQEVEPGAVVMTTQPHSLLYASGHPAIPLPAAEPPAAALAAAERYGARYLILTEAAGRYPDALEPPPPGFALLRRADLAGTDTRLYRLEPTAGR
jgi:hypothetical protein